ncbi:MAG TPA: SUMF1/EgtB/PvdO family nonheme iron enzyme [Candidatus Limnocylindria bacterium]|nr:SUMF1/EgtB/PvdO family nonheme iron enzyme [Candidatus Limnocylindria bacterium]
MALPLMSRGRRAAEELRERLIDAWARSDKIFAIVGSGQTLHQPIVWRHPFIFYIGHLPAFSWNQICGGILQWSSVNAYYDDLFCRGIDPDVDTGECHWHPEVPEDWPSLGDTLEYRDKVRRALLESTIALGYSRSNDLLAQGGRVFELILEHEFMHQETLLYMMQQMAPGDKIRPHDLPRYSFGRATRAESIRIPAGKARLGAHFEDLSFGWDNEFSEVTVDVESFAMDSLPVTNGAFFEFLYAGGYDEPRYWRPEDWRWRQLERKQSPTCWLEQEGSWWYKAMFDLLPLEQVASWPVSVSLAEARAYAAWRGKRLPTESEYHRAAFYGPEGVESIYPWGEAGPTPRHGNFDFTAWSPQPVGSHPAGASRWGVQELVGNGWELIDTPFAPLPGFTPYMTTYPDYSKDFFDGKHFVVKGASWATDAGLVRSSFRNWYQAHYPYVFAKFRCVTD